MSSKQLPIREDPPKPNTPVGIWVERLEPLLESPGEWFRVHETKSRNYATSSVSELRQRNLKIPLPDHEWEFTARGHRVYARYMGKPRKGKS